LNPDRDLVTHGSAWVVESTGRVVKTDIEVGEFDVTPKVTLTTTFKFDEALQIDVPGRKPSRARHGSHEDLLSGGTDGQASRLPRLVRKAGEAASGADTPVEPVRQDRIP
jgi:hypothetical protein